MCESGLIDSEKILCRGQTNPETLQIAPTVLDDVTETDALLLKYIEDSRYIWEGNLREVRYTSVGSVIGTHVGPGAVVVAFFKN